MIIKQEKLIPKEEFTNITKKVQRIITQNRVLNGVCIIYTKHTTACVRLLEPEVLLKKDMHDFLERIAPSSCKYRHDDLEHRSVPPEERRNGYSHLRAMLLNHQEIIPIVNGKLDLGQWQQIFYIECDLGKENRTFNILILREN